MLVFVLRLEFDKLGVFAVIVGCSDHNLNDESCSDDHTFEPANTRLDDHSWNDTDNGEKGDTDKNTIVEGIFH